MQELKVESCLESHASGCAPFGVKKTWRTKWPVAWCCRCANVVAMGLPSCASVFVVVLDDGLQDVGLGRVRRCLITASDRSQVAVNTSSGVQVVLMADDVVERGNGSLRHSEERGDHDISECGLHDDGCRSKRSALRFDIDFAFAVRRGGKE